MVEEYKITNLLLNMLDIYSNIELYLRTVHKKSISNQFIYYFDIAFKNKFKIINKITTHALKNSISILFLLFMNRHSIYKVFVFIVTWLINLNFHDFILFCVYHYIYLYTT